MSQESEEASSIWRRILTWLGGGALLLAMSVDTAAVVVRHLKSSIPGSIEVVQTAMLVASSSAIVAATLMRQHATVHLLIRRLQGAVQRRLVQGGWLLAGAFFIFLTCAGSLALHDLWNAHEQSDILHIPYAPLRLTCALATAAAAVILLVQGAGRRR